ETLRERRGCAYGRLTPTPTPTACVAPATHRPGGNLQVVCVKTSRGIHTNFAFDQRFVYTVA
ncbi:hypothetical protein, partial [Chamaesiphon sp. VAR_69_metabat_338]|uniref:hypothetical protein n=1 Tax=Chamaesiphon sp. VAR_69_metabat_338 TaxID=2964704 RepID=UPI00286E9ED0